MVASQVVRSLQTAPEMWLAADYAGRLLSIAILLTPAVRPIAFKRERSRVHFLEAGLWTLLLIAFHQLVLGTIGSKLDAALPGTQLHSIPKLHGGLFVVDLSFGLLLVAIHEEIVFRRLALALLRPVLGGDLIAALVSAVPFGLYHWQFGVGTVVSAALFGVCAMLVYLRVGSIVPLVIAHYLIDALLMAGSLASRAT